MRHWKAALVIVLLSLAGSASAATDAQYDVLARKMIALERRVATLEAENIKLKKESAVLRTEIRALKTAADRSAPAAKSAVLPAGESLKSPTPLLTDNEYQQVLASIAKFSADLSDGGHGGKLKAERAPLVIVRHFEWYKFNEKTQRWDERPVIPNMNAPHYFWHKDGRSYQSQLWCKICGGFVNAQGTVCHGNHPISETAQWYFMIKYFKDRDRAIEAKAHLWNAKIHGDITEEMWEKLMVDGFRASEK